MLKRILVIDDDEDILDILQLILQEEGFQVIVSNTAQAAEYIHFINPNLILLDIRLDGSDKTGADICKDFKTEYPENMTPIVLLSAERNIRYLANQSGADGYISKPFDIVNLIDKVNSLILE